MAVGDFDFFDGDFSGDLLLEDVRKLFLLFETAKLDEIIDRPCTSEVRDERLCFVI